MNKAIPILILYLFLFSVQLAAQELESETSTLDVSFVSELLSFEDSLGTVTNEKILSGAFDNDFEIYQSEESSIDLDIAVYWIKFSIQNPNNLDQDLLLEFTNWSLVEVFYKENSKWNVLKTGSLMPNGEKSFPFMNTNLIRTNIEGKEEQEFYAKLYTRFNGAMKPSKLNFKMGGKDRVLNQQYISLAFSFLFLGIFLIMIFYNGFIYISTADKSYRFYLLTLFVYLFSVIENAGLINQLLPNYNQLPNLILVFSSLRPVMLTLFVLLFVKDFYRVKERYPFWSKRINYLIVYVLLSTIVLWLNYDFGTILLVLATFPFLYFVLAIGLRSYRENFPGAIYVVIGHVLWFIFGIAAMMGTIHPWAREKEFFSDHALFVGASLEMMLFALALANTINYLMRENKSKQERIIKQLQENSELQTKVNRELESKVAERTNELLKQSQEIETQKKDLEIEKDRSDSLLLNILPREIADELKMSGHATPKYYESVTVLFVDITSFSKMVRKLSPEKLVEGLDYLFSEFDDITTKYNLEKIKTIGDAYMCVGGLPQTNDTHPFDATHAAFEMLEVIADWAKNIVEIDQEGLNLRTGIHTGPVTAGVVGKKKFQFDIWGDAVNLASRMESGGEGGKVNVSEKTYHLIKERFNCSFRGKFQVKNMGEVNMYFADGVKAPTNELNESV